MTNAVKSPRGRPTRTPVSKRNILVVKGQDPNFHYRVVNDVGDRIQMFMEGGYELVNSTENVKVGDSRLDTPSADGSKVKLAVGRREKQDAYLMRIPKDLYEEDQANKEEHRRLQEQDMSRRAKEEGFDGFIKQTRD